MKAETGLKKWAAAILSVMILAGAGLPCAVARAAAFEAEQPQGMFDLYGQNRKEGIPNYITEDFMLLSYAMVLNEAITDLEEEVLHPALTRLTKGLVRKLTSEPVQDEARSNLLNVLAVIANLAGDRDSELMNKSVAEELEKIEAAEGIAFSELTRQRIDYGQFKVRGKYTRSEALGRYFKAVKYAGSVFFPVQASKATGITAAQADLLTREALLLARLIHDDQSLLATHQKLDRILTTLFGPAEDLRLEDYVEVDRNMKEAPVREKRRALLEMARKEGRQPIILSRAVNVAALEKGVTARDVLTGLRMLPQRYTPDSAAMQQLVYDRVTDYLGQGNPFSLTVVNGRKVKGLPLGLELMALLGSSEAEKILAKTDELNFRGYRERSKEAKRLLVGSGDIASNHFKLIRFWLTAEPPAEVDENRRLNTSLAFWTYGRHLNLVYAKQSYTAVGKSLALPSDRKIAWLEPAPELYLHLENQARRLAATLDNDLLADFAAVLVRCGHISFKELQGLALSQDEVRFLNHLDLELLPLTGGKDRPIVVDVHTEPNSGVVLEEAVGFPRVVTKSMGGKRLRGALFSYYEFKQPMERRLTDDEWQAILAGSRYREALQLSPGSMPGKSRKEPGFF